MPQLKQLSCCIQWSETGAPFQEHGTIYGDGVVETFIIVPNKPQVFSIRVTSQGFVFEGLAVIVFIDGNYQCNRSRVNLLPPTKDRPTNRTEIDFTLRQKEKSQGDGLYLGREWRFDNHNIIPQPPGGFQESHFDDLGIIEVLILRCHAKSRHEADYEGLSSGEDSDIFAQRPSMKDETEESSVKPAVTTKADPSSVVAPSQEEEGGGMGFMGLFDGANDQVSSQTFGSNFDGPAGNWVWHQKHAPFTQPSEGYQYSKPSGQYEQSGGPQADPVPQHHTFSNRHSGPRQPEKRVHFDYGHSSNQFVPPSSVGPPPLLHQPLPQRPPSRVRERRPSYGWRNSSNNAYEPQRFYPAGSQVEGQTTQESGQRHKNDQGPGRQSENFNLQRNEEAGYQTAYPAHQSRPSSYTNSGHARPVESAQSMPLRQEARNSYSRDTAQLGSHMQEWPRRVSNYGPQEAPVGQPPVLHHVEQSNIGRPEQSTSLPIYPHPYGQWPASRNNHVPHFAHPPSHQPHMHPYYQSGQMPPVREYLHAPHPSHWPVPLPPTYGQPYVAQPFGHSGWILQPPHPIYLDSGGKTNPENTSANGEQAGKRNQIGPDGAVSAPLTQENAQSETCPQDVNNDTPDNGNETGNNEDPKGGQNQDSWAADQPSHLDNDDQEAAKAWEDPNNESWNASNDQNDKTWGNDASNNTNANDWNTSNDQNNGWGTADNNQPNNSTNSWDQPAAANGLSDPPNPGAATIGTDDLTHTQLRDLYGPHGPYYALRAVRVGEPVPDAEEEPRFDVPKSLAEERQSTKQVQPGPGYRYYKKRMVPEYVDTLENPYARFVFKYRTRDQIQNEVGIEIDTEPTANAEMQDLQALDKQTLVEMLIRAKGALGGKVPSPPLTPSRSSQGSEVDTPTVIDAPKRTFLRYMLPPQRPNKVSIDKSNSSDTKSARSVSDNAGKENMNNASNKAGGWNDSGNNVNNTQTPNIDWNAVADGASAKHSKQAETQAGQGWGTANDNIPPRPPTPPGVPSQPNTVEQNWDSAGQQASNGGGQDPGISW